MKNVKDKIKSAREIVAIIGSRLRSKTVCMCHGTFDIVHPGHLRHLMFAKEHADILVASITADKHVTKANFRPYVNEQLRALNLAAFEMVDYVVIDDEPTPLKNLGLIQPDYFAKGYEYAGGTPNTQAEASIVESYGGEMLFTPGDVVYSSSALINASPPNIAVETLLTTMEAHGATFDDLRSALDAMQGLRVHVVGDTIVDTITETVPTGGLGKTPTLSVQIQSRKDYVGGAAIVAKHLSAAGAQVSFSTVLGDDDHGRMVIADLTKSGIDLHHTIDPTRPTTNKNAFVASGYRLLKADTLDNRSISGKILDRVAGSVVATPTDIVLFSDFRHGIFNRDTIQRLTRAIPAGAFRVADSQVASRWGNILDFTGFDLITPNEREARFALGDQDSVVRPLASRLYEEAGCKTLIMKMGDRGVLTQSAPTGEGHYLYVVPSFVNRLVDAVGAGDALVAYATLALKATGSALIASILGSIAAALECERDGNIPVSAGDVLARIDELERDAQYGPLKESTRSMSASPLGASRPSISRARAAIVEAVG